MEINEYKLTFGNRVIIYPGHNGYVMFNGTQPKSLTLYASEGGTLTANELTGYPGDTINLSTAYNTYWRFSGYQWTGDGTLANNTYTFGTEDATICACYKVNAFTASGGFEKGSNISISPPNSQGTHVKAVPTKYAITSYHTSNVPTAWYSTSNRWKPNGASAYKINVTAAMTFQGGGYAQSNARTATVVSLIGGTQTATATSSNFGAVQRRYYKTWNTTTQGVNYGVSANMRCSVSLGNGTWYKTDVTYVATGTNGQWVATGIAP